MLQSESAKLQDKVLYLVEIVLRFFVFFFVLTILISKFKYQIS
jgi:hypothetical protein